MNDPRPAPHPPGRLMILGIGQAVGFVAGALLGRWVGLLLGWDALAPGSGFTAPAMAGITLIGLLGGAGVQAARVAYVARYGDPRA